MESQYLIAEILLERGLPETVVQAITKLGEPELDRLKSKWAGESPATDFQL